MIVDDSQVRSPEQLMQDAAGRERRLINAEEAAERKLTTAIDKLQRAERKLERARRRLERRLQSLNRAEQDLRSRREERRRGLAQGDGPNTGTDGLGADDQ